MKIVVLVIFENPNAIFELHAESLNTSKKLSSPSFSSRSVNARERDIKIFLPLPASFVSAAAHPPVRLKYN